MSSGPACRVNGHTHVVIDRRCNHSAFNGYHRTPSDYSAVLCLQTRDVWRSKSAYVDRLPDITPEQESAWLHGPAPVENR